MELPDAHQTRSPLAALAILATLAMGWCTGCGEKEGDSAKAASATQASSNQSTGEKGEKGEEHAEVKLTPEAIRRHGIKVGGVERHVLADTFAAPARVTYDPDRVAKVGSAVPGRVADVKAKLGDSVKKDDLLLVIESPELGTAQSDLLEKRVALEAVQAAVAPAKQALERAKTLFEQNQGIALAELQKREADLTAANAAVRTAQAGLQAAQSRLRLLGMDDAGLAQLVKTGQVNPRYEIHSPLAGQVVDRDATLGQLTGPDKDVLFTIADLGTLWVIADVPEARLKDVRIGSRARITAGEAEAGEGKVAWVSPAIDPGTRTAAVRIEVKAEAAEEHEHPATAPTTSAAATSEEHGEAPGARTATVPTTSPTTHPATSAEAEHEHGEHDEHAESHVAALRPGMFVTANIEIPDPAGPAPALAVPESAVQTIEGKPCVFVAGDEENTFVKREIKTGPPVGEWVPVLDGLKEGEKIVVEGTFVLKADLGKEAGGD